MFGTKMMFDSPKDIRPKNDEGNLHGYCKSYWRSGKLMWSGVRVNGGKYGYCEYYYDGAIDKYCTGYFLDDARLSADNKEGYCIIWNKKEL